MQESFFPGLFQNFTVFFTDIKLVVLEALEFFFFFYVIDFTLFDISFVFFWNIIFFLGFSFGTGSDLYHFFFCRFTFCFYITCFIASNKTAIGGQ